MIPEARGVAALVPPNLVVQLSVQLLQPSSNAVVDCMKAKCEVGCHSLVKMTYHS